MEAGKAASANEANIRAEVNNKITHQRLAELKESAIRATVDTDVKRERLRQDDKWGPQSHDNRTWLAILMEEVGEASQAILHKQFGGPAAENIRDELVQVAAVAHAWIEDIDRKGEE